MKYIFFTMISTQPSSVAFLFRSFCICASNSCGSESLYRFTLTAFFLRNYSDNLNLLKYLAG